MTNDGMIVVTGATGKIYVAETMDETWIHQRRAGGRGEGASQLQPRATPWEKKRLHVSEP